MVRLDNFYIFKKIFNYATDAASSKLHKKNLPTLGNGKFGCFGPPITLLT